MLRRCRPVYGASLVVSVAMMAAVLGACSSMVGTSEETRPPDVMDRGRSIDLLPRFPQPAEPNRNEPDRRRNTIYNGSQVTEVEGARVASRTDAAGAQGAELHFRSTP